MVHEKKRTEEEQKGRISRKKSGSTAMAYRDKEVPRLPQYIYSLPVSVSHAFKVNLELGNEKKKGMHSSPKNLYKLKFEVGLSHFSLKVGSFLPPS